MSFALNLWKDKSAPVPSSDPSKVQKFSSGVVPKFFTKEEEDLEWNSLGFVKTKKQEQPAHHKSSIAAVSLLSSPSAPSSVDLNMQTPVFDPTQAFVSTLSEQAALRVPQHIDIATSSSKRARLKQEALDRIYGTNSGQFESALADKARLGKISHTTQPTRPLASPLDPIAPRKPSINSTSSLQSKKEVKLTFIKQDGRKPIATLPITSVTDLHRELEEKSKRLKEKQEEEAYIAYRKLIREEQIKRDSAFRGSLSSEELAVDDTDVEGDELARNEWELRELERIERELNLQPPQEESTEDSTNIETREESEPTKYRFLQKYYHKGAFFADDNDPILSRDYNLPTEADAIDKSMLPEILQVKDFGKKSRSKWKHLSAEDTTAFDGYGWYQKNDAFAETMASRMAGLERKRT